MELIIDNTDRLQNAVRSHYEERGEALREAVIDDIEAQRIKSKKEAHQTGKQRLEREKVSIDKRMKHKYNLERSSVAAKIRHKKKDVYIELQNKVEEQIEQSEDLQKCLLAHIETIVKKSSGAKKVSVQHEEPFITSKAEVRTENKRYTVTVQDVVKKVLDTYWADIAPDVRL